jgi:malonate-semialdehyde dehydrogenase (acetylating)/methylmalonate-semialdehyde dehydrogenase
VVDGRTLEVQGDGFFVGPTLLDGVTPDMSVYRDEIFGPVLSVVRVASLAEAIELINANAYANGTRSSRARGRPRGSSSATSRSG